MVSNNATLNICLQAADDVEAALNSLGDTSHWPADHQLRQQCAHYRSACRELANQKGLGQLAIAFIGPKNAGKTTLLSMLVRPDALRDQLSAGEGLAGSTERIRWISTHPIDELNRDVEESLHVDPSDLVNLGCDYTLVDVPGANEANRSRAAAAERALRAAHLKVLVVEARTMEDATLLDYVANADGATILPIINQIRPGTEDQEIDGFLATLKHALPASNILSPLRIGDFQLASEASPEGALADAAKRFRARLQEFVHAEKLDELLEPQLLRMKARFEDDIRATLTDALPATAAAAQELRQFEDTLATQALERLLGADDHNRTVQAALRQQLRAVYQQRTPVLFFPWRMFVSLANVLHGALEKVPLLLAGSLPSLVSSAMTAVKNVTRDREFQTERSEGLRKHAEWLVKESLFPKVSHLEAALRSDLRNESLVSERDGLQVEFEGLELLQARSSTLYQETLDAKAPGRAATWVTGLIGLAIFWGIFIWPSIALYKEYFAAVNAFVDGQAQPAFPKDSFSVIGTSFLLALFPMLFWLLLVLSWVATRSRARECLHMLRQGHQQIIEDLHAQRLLRVHAHHPHLAACLRLFSLKS